MASPRISLTKITNYYESIFTFIKIWITEPGETLKDGSPDSH